MATRAAVHAACLVGYVLSVSAMLVYAAARPAHNVDLIDYVGAALADTGLAGDELHARTYAVLRETLPADDYRLLTENSPYLHDMAADAESFRQNLPFFLVKPLYPSLMSVLARLGVDLPSAALVISIAAGALLGLVTYVWLAAYAPVPYRAAFGALLLAGYMVAERGACF